MKGAIRALVIGEFNDGYGGILRPQGGPAVHEYLNWGKLLDSAETLKSGWTLAAFITVSGPKGLPGEIACSYEAAVAKAFKTRAWADFKASRGSDVVNMSRKELGAMLVRSDANLGATMKAIGLAK